VSTLQQIIMPKLITMHEQLPKYHYYKYCTLPFYRQELKYFFIFYHNKKV